MELQQEDTIDIADGQITVKLNQLLSKTSRIYRGVLKHDCPRDEDIAVKMLPIISQEDALPLKKEADVIRDNPHSNIVKYILADFSSNRLMSMFLAMELCCEQNLHDHILKMRITNRQFSYADCMSCAKQIACGLAYIHKKGVLHRDIKPSNILFSLNKKVLKITDFSLSKPLLPSRSVTALSSKRIGTDGWRAPEVYNRNEFSPQSDVFSFGLLLYFVWSNGNQAFGTDPDLTNYNIKKNRNRNLENLIFPDSMPAKELLEHVLAFDRRERMSAEDVLNHDLCKSASDELRFPEGCQATIHERMEGEREEESSKIHGECAVVFDRTSSLMHAFQPQSGKWCHMQKLTDEIISWDFNVVMVNNCIYTLLQNQRVYRLEFQDKNAHWHMMDKLLYDHGALPAATVLGGLIYVIGGSQWGSKVIKKGERFDPDEGLFGKWTTIPDMKSNRKVHSIIACNGHIYSIGGWDRSCVNPNVDGEAAVASGERFSPVLDKWEEIKPMHNIRYATATAAIGNEFYVMGGWREGNRLTEMESYNTVTRQWTILAKMNIGRSFFNAVAVQGKIYAISGDDKSPQTLEEYDPETNSWKMLDSLTNMHVWVKGSVAVVM